MELSGINWWVLSGALLTWLIFILGVAQLSRFYTRFCNTSKELDANLLAVAAQLKKIQSAMSEIIIEQRRTSRLILEQVDLKKAEMTGEFEIIEEPLTEAKQSPAKPGIVLPDDK
jgi:predicted lipoprotein